MYCTIVSPSGIRYERVKAEHAAHMVAVYGFKIVEETNA